MTTADIVKTLDKMVASLRDIRTEVNNLRNEVQNLSLTADQYTALNAKIDMLSNVSTESRAAIATEASTTRKPTKPSFFKKIFVEERAKYINILYTQDEIDLVYAHEEVALKKKDADKATKAAGMLYRNHIKEDAPAGRLSAFESIYAQAYPSQ